MLNDFDYDLVVIGGGSGGVRAARTAANLGARVALVEAGALGGTCVNVGCVPKKLLSYGAHFRADIEDAAGYGWKIQGEPAFSWPVLKAAKDKEIARLNSAYRDLLDRADVEIVAGWGSFLGPHRISVRRPEAPERILTGRYALIATGGKPTRPVFPGAELAAISDDLFAWEELPKRVVILGGGYIGVEFASILSGFGVEVHLVIRGETPLRGFDEDLRREIASELRKGGVHLRTQCGIVGVERGGEQGYLARCLSGDVIDCGRVLLAVGREPNVQGLALDAAGVSLSERGAVLVDDHFQTTAPSIYAVGDVIARLQLTPVALGEAMVVADQLFGSKTRQIDYRNLPTAVFTSPPIATVGLTEADARKRGPVRLFKSRFRPMKHTLSGRDERTLMKIVVDAQTDRVLGMHMIGPDAPEIIQGFAAAMQCGATKAMLDATIGIHPTAAEEFVTMRTEWT